MYFEEVYSEAQESRKNFSENVRDSFGNSICEELFDKFTTNLETVEHMCDAANIREGIIKAMLVELRMIL